MTQDQLAAKMALLGHRWHRSIVSAIESGGRSVTIDELFGLAISFGVTLGRMLDPSGPDGSRDFGLDVGLGPVGHSNPLPTQLGRLFAASRASIRLVDEDQSMIDIDMASDAAVTLPQELLDELGLGVGSPVRKRLGTTSPS